MLNIIQAANSAAQLLEQQRSHYALPFIVDGVTIGHIRRADVLPACETRDDVFEISTNSVAFHHNINTFQLRTASIAHLLLQWRTEGVLDSALKGWRDELYPVYGQSGRVLFHIERSAAPLFGVRIYGCHLNGYLRCTATNQMLMWVARRASTKQTYPHMLDNLVCAL
jgi:hypothetical protein